MLVLGKDAPPPLGGWPLALSYLFNFMNCSGSITSFSQSMSARMPASFYKPSQTAAWSVSTLSASKMKQWLRWSAHIVVCELGSTSLGGIEDMVEYNMETQSEKICCVLAMLTFVMFNILGGITLPSGGCRNRWYVWSFFIWWNNGTQNFSYSRSRSWCKFTPGTISLVPRCS